MSTPGSSPSRVPAPLAPAPVSRPAEAPTPDAAPRDRARVGRLPRILALSAVIGALCVPTAAPAHARPVDPEARRDRVSAQIAESRADLADLSAASARALAALRRTQSALPAARAALRDAQADAAQARAQAAEVATHLRAARAREAAGLAALRRNAVATQAAADERDDLARIAYESGGSGDLIALFDVGSAVDLAQRAHVIEEVGAHHSGVVQDLRAARVLRLVEQAKLEGARREISQLLLRAQAASARATSAASAAATRSAQLAALADRQRSEQAAVEGQKDKEAARLASLEAESGRLSALLRARAQQQARIWAQTGRAASTRSGGSSARTTSQASSRSEASARPSRSARSAPASTGGVLGRPTTAPVTSTYGMRMHPILGYARLHAGTDYGTGCGAPVYAAADGQVVRAGWAGGYGNQVVLAHDGPLATSYSHLTSIATSIAVDGGWVRRGQLVGHSGTTGLSTGCHLHFEVRVNGSPVDSRRYF